MSKLKYDEVQIAVDSWEELLKKHSDFVKFFIPNGRFIIPDEHINWMKSHNQDCSNFHVYFGVKKEEIILIFVPLDHNHKEKTKLVDYRYSVLTEIKEKFSLIEREVVTNIKKTSFSKDLDVLNYKEITKYSVYKRPDLKENITSEDIINWKSHCMDWFYHEIINEGSRRIFRAFIVPFSDINVKKEKEKELSIVFGMKYSSIYKMKYPILVFITSRHKDDSKTVLLSKRSEETISETNSKDFSSPCPPFCKDKYDFKFLKK
ncbi:hypothetical protein [Aureivirga sp. CE67]|uniref:hypothetical protein n=1 Tax=Aureivirga sp. CE67 TaxID=1788983 RepID=UPI0018CACB2D|nr:hypothetical protein [Aureivirga sp. CE67]